MANTSRDGIVRAGRMAAVALAYFAVGRFGLFLPIDDRAVAVLWPAAGFALAALLLWGPEQWMGVAIGAMLVPLARGRWAMLHRRTSRG